jgi:hypothetical protein
MQTPASNIEFAICITAEEGGDFRDWETLSSVT